LSDLLKVKGLKKHYPITKGILITKAIGSIKAVDGVGFSIGPKETFALVGESGCGKSTTCRLILLLEKPTEGQILFQDRDIYRLDKAGVKAYRSSVQTIFQDPFSSLNPRMRIGSIVVEPLEQQGELPRNDMEERVNQSLERVGISPDGAKQRYPHMFSGGQRQRIALARALVANPSLIILDEPVSALDVSIRAQILNLLHDLQDDLGVAYLLVAHNLATVRYMSQKVAVMYLGKIVEIAESEELFRNPLHPYTRALISASLPSHPDQVKEPIKLPGEVASAAAIPSGCSFHPRCPLVEKICSVQDVTLRPVGDNHLAACHMIEVS
jgi:oligopeptide/dipeptide ABC transporter ATP-binding protein